MKSLKKILLLLIWLFIFNSSYADNSYYFDLTSEGNLSPSEWYYIWTIEVLEFWDINYNFECYHNSLNGEIRFFLSWSTYISDCNETSYWYTNNIWQWSNIFPGSYDLYVANNLNPNYIWWAGEIYIDIKDKSMSYMWWTWAISQTFIDLDLSDFDYQSKIVTIPSFSGATHLVDNSIPFSNIAKILYEIKIILMINWLFLLIFVIYSIINDLLWKR